MISTSKKIIEVARITGGILCVFLLSFLTVSAATKVNSQFLNRLTNGLVAHWTFDAPDVSFTGSTISIKDRSTNANHGTFSTTATSTRRVLGKIGQALKFNGTADYFRAPTSSNYDFGANNFAVSWWENRPTNQGGAVAIARSTGVIGYNPFLLGYSSGSGNLLIYMSSTYSSWNIAEAKSLGVVTLNVWNHFVVTRNGSTFTAYKNGVQTDTWTSSTAFTAPSGNTDLIFGRYTYGIDYLFNGSLDDVRFYNRAFSAADVKSLYSLGQTTLQKTQNSKVASALIGLWSFDGADMLSTRAYDRSGQGNNATLTNFGSTATTSRKMGALGQALNFDGVDDYAVNSTVVNTPKVTISAWVKLAAFPVANGHIAGFMNGIASGTHDKNLYIDPSGMLYFYVHDGATQTTSAPTDPIPLNQWVHVVGTADGTDAKAYVNGVEVGTVPAGDTYTAYNVPNIFIQGETGAVAFGGGYMEATIDDVRVYNRAISADEIKRLYSLGGGKINASKNNRLTNGLIGLWSFDGKDVDATYAYDRSGQAHDGTLVEVSAAIGKIGQAFNFNGTSQYVTLPDINTAAGPPSSFALWLKRGQTNAASDEGLMGYSGSGCFGQNVWGIGIAAGANTNKLFVTAVGINAVYSTGTITDLNWHHVVFTLDGTNVRFYIDGALDSTVSYSSTFTCTASSAFAIGTVNTSGWYKGALDDIRIYNRVLSASDIKSLYVLGK